MKWISVLAILCLLCGGSSARKKQLPAKQKRPEAAAPTPLSTRRPLIHAAPVDPVPPKAVATPVKVGGGRDVVQRESKIEFDERLVQGQTASGAIYLFQRGESEFNSMVHVPSSFRPRSIQTVLGEKR